MEHGKTEVAPSTPKKSESAPLPTQSPKQEPKAPTSRNSMKPTNPNRPTYRTNKKLTKRDIKEHEKQMVNRQLMKDQMKVTFFKIDKYS